MIGIENPVFQVRRPMKRFITVEMFRKKKSKTFQGIINFSQFYWNDRKFPVPLLHVDYKCQASTRAIAKNLTFFFFFIAQNAYCSRDIYFQFNKVCWSVISCVDAMKAPQRLVALNALGCSLIWCRWQTKQRGQFAIVSPFIRKSHICAYFAATF